MPSSISTRLRGVWAALVLLLVIAGCDGSGSMDMPDEDVSDAAITQAKGNKVRIMPIGDSITQGNEKYDSYRRDLWHLLRRNGYTNVNFVGNYTLNHRSGSGASGAGAQPPNRDFDQNHQADSGMSTDIVERQVRRAPATDIALVHLGHNDVSYGQSTASTLNDLKRLVSTLRKKNPNVTVLMAKVVNSCGRRKAGIIDLNKRIPALASKLNTNRSRVILVDQAKRFDPRRHAYDCTHPNEAGQRVMAQTWFNALKPLLNGVSGGGGNPPSQPKPSPKPSDPPSSGSFPKAGQWYQFKNVATGTYIDTSNRGRLKMQANASGDDSHFRFIPAGQNRYWIDTRRNGRGALDTSGRNVVQWKSNDRPGGSDKLWTVESAGNGTYRIKNVRSGRHYLHASGQKVKWNTGGRNNSTRWKLVRVN